jgi:hypothetical protein
MNSTWPSAEGLKWESGVWQESRLHAGVRFRTLRMSLARRADLTRRVRGLLERLEFHGAGEGPADKLEAGLLELEIDRTYIEWGLLELEGLEIDGGPASVRALVERGPEELCREIAAAIRASCGLTEAERKN